MKKKNQALVSVKKGSTSISTASSASQNNSNLLSSALPSNKGREKVLTENPFLWTIVVPLMCIEGEDCLKLLGKLQKSIIENMWDLTLNQDIGTRNF